MAGNSFLVRTEVPGLAVKTLSVVFAGAAQNVSDDGAHGAA
jgi:hypothetical protein